MCTILSFLQFNIHEAQLEGNILKRLIVKKIHILISKNKYLIVQRKVDSASERSDLQDECLIPFWI